MNQNKHSKILLGLTVLMVMAVLGVFAEKIYALSPFNLTGLAGKNTLRSNTGGLIPTSTFTPTVQAATATSTSTFTPTVRVVTTSGINAASTGLSTTNTPTNTVNVSNSTFTATFTPSYTRTATFTFTPTKTNTVAPTGGLLLKVLTNSCGANQVQDFFMVVNNGNPVTLSDITIKYWVNDTTGSDVAGAVNTGGCLTNPSCFHQVSGVTLNAVKFSPACGSDATHMANWELTLSTTDPSVLPTGNSWSNIQTALHLSTYSNFAPGSSTWYSPCLSGNQYMQDVHYAIYLKGVLVASSGAVPPSCRTNPSGPVTIVLTTVPFNRIKPAIAKGPVTFSGVTADWNTKSVFGASHHVTPGNVGKLDGVLFLMYNDPTLVDGFKFTRLYNITGSGPDAEVHVMLKTKGGVGDLKNILNKVAAVSGDIVGGTVRVRDISKLQASSSVIRAEIAPRCHPLLDLARPAVKVDQVFNSSCLDGSGVLEGIVDTGIDWKHTDFQSLTPSQTPSGKSRIKFIWDMDLVPLAGETPGPMFSGSPLGVLYSRTQINTALAVNPSLVRSQDGYASGEGGHGTHVAGIIGSSSAQYRGMAPACDYGIVRLPDPKGDLGWSYDLIEAGVGAIFDRAGTQPAVVNLSLGDQTGAHDGTELIDQALDNYLVTGGTPIQKRAICIAAGNDGNVTTNPIHAEGKIPAGGTVIIPFLEAETGTVDVWLQGGASYSGVNVYQQDAGGWFYTTPLPFGTPDASGLWYQVTANVAPACNEMISPNVVANEVNSLNNDYHLQFTAGYAYVDNLWNPCSSPPAVMWAMKLYNSSSTDSSYDVWVGSPNNAIILLSNAAVGLLPTNNYAITNNRTVGEPGTTKRAITVASYCTKLGFMTTSLGAISLFSSHGPIRPNSTNLGIAKPDVTAPGEQIVSTLSSFIPVPTTVASDGKHQFMSGTSMACPMVTGVVALMFQKNNQLDSAKVRNILANPANAQPSNSFTGSLRNDTWGAGILDAVNATTAANVNTTACCGSLWNKVGASVTFSERAGFAKVVFTDPLDNLPKMWVIGGTDASGVVLHDVYKSTDGASWYPATTSAPFGELGTESAVVFDAGQGAGPEIWVVGNSDGTAYNQLYHSKNGVTWSSSTSNFMLGPGHTVVTFPDVNDGNKMKIWVIGGHAGWTPAQIILPTSASEVWNSSDGVNFAQVVGTTTTVANITSGVATPGLLLYNNFHTCVVFTDPADGISKLWVIGGGGNGFAGCSTACPTVFCSVDGKTWEPKTNTAGFGQRDYHQSFVYCGRMWLIGGYQGGCCGFDNDVWNSTDGITWYQETAAATTAITPPLVPTGLSETVDGGRARFGAIPYNGALWIFGGTKTISGVGSWDLNDVWKTP